MPRIHSTRQDTRPTFKSLHWADRTGIVIAATLAAMAAGFWIIICVAAGSFAYTRLNASMLEWTLYGEFALAVPIWATLRCGALVVDYSRRAWRSLRSGLTTGPAAMKPDPGWR